MKNYGSIHNIEDSEEYIGTSKFRSVLSQCCGVLASDSIKFTSSTFTGFHIILIAELLKKDAEIIISLDQLTWIASMNFLVPIGSIVYGFVAQRLGTRFVMLTTSIFFVTTWLLYYNATTVSTLVAARVLYSITNGALKSPTSAYITEISQPHFRGSFLATCHLAATFGMFFSLLMGSLVYWRTIALINLIFPVVSFVAVLFIPESPMWLASKNRFKEAELALSWLRGWVSPNQIRSEYLSIVQNTRNTSTSKTINYPYLKRSFYLPLSSITLIYIIHFFSGVSAIQTYSMVLFSLLNSPIDDSIATAVMGSMRVIGACIILLTIRAVGKRGLAFFSLVVAGSCYLTISAIGFLDVRSEIHGWISTVGLLLAVFANSSGVETIVHMINSEIFPVGIRYVGSAIGGSISSIVQAIMSKAFFYMLDWLSLPGLFLYFALMNIIAIITYRYLLPETEGRSLKEIEEYYASTKKLAESSSE